MIMRPWTILTRKFCIHHSKSLLKLRSFGISRLDDFYKLARFVCLLRNNEIYYSNFIMVN